MPLARLEDLVHAALTCGLIGPEKRRALLHRLPMGFVYSLPTVSRPIDQLRFDLMELQRTPRLIGLDQPPLAVWLQNAADLAAAEGKADAARLFARRADALMPSVDASATIERQLAKMRHGMPSDVEQASTAHSRVPASSSSPPPRAAPRRVHVLALDSAGKGHWRTVDPPFEATTVHEVEPPRGDWTRSHPPHSAPWRTLLERIDRHIRTLVGQFEPGDGIRVFTRNIPSAAAILIGSRLKRHLPSANVEYFEHVRLRGRGRWRSYGPCWPGDVARSSQAVLGARLDGLDRGTKVVAVCIQVDRRIDVRAVDDALKASGLGATGRLTLSHRRPRGGAVVEPGEVERALADCAEALDRAFDKSSEVRRLHLFFGGPPALSIRVVDELLDAGTSVTVYVEQTDGYAPAVLLAPRIDARLVPEPSRPDGTGGYDVFIAFASVDRELANHLFERLTDRGLTVFLDERSLLPGDVWTQAIPSALAGSRSVVALLSPRPKGGPGPGTGWYQDEELIAAIRHARRSADALRLFPVLLAGLEPREMPYGLHGLNAIRVPDTLGSPGAQATGPASLDAIAGFIDAQLAPVLPEPSEPKPTT